MVNVVTAKKAVALYASFIENGLQGIMIFKDLGTRTLACAILMMILIAVPLTLFAAGGASQDKAPVAARDAFLAGDRVKLARQAEKFLDHVLEPYAGYWRLRLRLAEADPDELRAFLALNAGTALAEQLRRDWLRLLGKNGQWDLFRQEHPVLVRDDPDVACYAIQARWLSQEEPVPIGIKRYWMMPEPLPEGCAAVADALLRSGDLTSQDLRDRFRLLVRAGLITEAKRIAERMPAEQAPRARRIDGAVKSPAAFLERAGAEMETAAGRELAIVALTRLAQIDPQAAVNRWNGKLQERFSREERLYVWGVLATQGARRHLPEAVDWFKEAGETPLSDEQLAWRARIALRQENWLEVKTAIERMASSVFSEPTWIY
ncbi:MAG: hypothetical protein IH628_04355, partial [Proteobacteria bacterium]|nr:hypothetical protein [Pseudomonadota bacterium]